MKNTSLSVKFIFTAAVMFAAVMIFNSAEESHAAYSDWKSAGEKASDKAVAMIKKAGAAVKRENLIVLTNAGYAEADGVSTQGALDGIVDVTGVTRGKNTLLEIHTAPWAPLWFAVYDSASGFCAYLEADPLEPLKYNTAAVERIDAEYLYTHAPDYNEKFKKNVFGGNEFRLLTIANAAAKGAPASVIRTVEFHDHYCPGVNSGIFMVNYIKKNFPPDDKGYFIQSVTPWCKEDAFQVMLNVTLGKKSYSIYHPSDSDIEARDKDLKDVSTIVYRHDNKADRWEGIALVFNWPDKKNESTGNGLIDKVRESLWYLENIDKPEDFVRIAKSFKLPGGTAPVDWARPGVDPLKKISKAEK